MAYILGKDLIIKSGEVKGEKSSAAEVTAIAGATTCNISISAEVLNTTAKGDGNWTSNMAGLKSWTIDTDALFTLKDFAYVENVGKKMTIEVSAGDNIYTGQAIINDLKINSGTGEIVTYNLTMTGTGELKKKEVAGPGVG